MRVFRAPKGHRGRRVLRVIQAGRLAPKGRKATMARKVCPAFKALPEVTALSDRRERPEPSVLMALQAPKVRPAIPVARWDPKVRRARMEPTARPVPKAHPVR